MRLRFSAALFRKTLAETRRPRDPPLVAARALYLPGSGRRGQEKRPARGIRTLNGRRVNGLLS